MARYVHQPTQRNRIRLWVALRAFVKSARNPDDTENGARFVLALEGNRGEQIFQRLIHGSQRDRTRRGDNVFRSSPASKGRAATNTKAATSNELRYETSSIGRTGCPRRGL